MECLSICFVIFDFLHQCHNFLYTVFFLSHIPRCFILFVAMVSGIDSLIALSDFSLLVYRNSSDFYVLILYPATLLNSLISSSNFLILSLGFSMYSFLSSANTERFYVFFSDLDSFYVFFFSDCCNWTSKTMLNNSGESGHP